MRSIGLTQKGAMHLTNDPRQREVITFYFYNNHKSNGWYHEQY